MKISPVRAFFREPGSTRILFGGLLVLLLVLAAALGPRLSPFAPDEMDLEQILVPPSSALLQGLTLTGTGRANLEARYPGRYRNPDEAGADGREGPASRNAEEAGRGMGEGRPDGENASGGAGNGEEAEDEYGFLAAENAEPGPAGEAAAASSGEPSPALRAHPLGTDKEGRDMLALLLAGARSCLLPGLLACAVALGLGLPLGLHAGFRGGLAAQVVRVLNAVILSLPRLMLILLFICAFQPDIHLSMALLGFTLAPRVAELMQARVSLLREQGLVLAAREGGLRDLDILLRHLFWYQNRPVLFIQLSLVMAESILVETTLSYLQFGTKPPEVSWGNIVEGSRMAFFSGFYWITLFPALAIVLAILGFFYLGDGLNARLAHREGR